MPPNFHPSHRSTKSEKMYPSMLSRAPDLESEPFYSVPVGAMAGAHAQHQAAAAMVPWSQPTSPTPPLRSFVAGQLSPTHPSAAAAAAMAGHRLTYPKKNDEGMFMKRITRMKLTNRITPYFANCYTVHGSAASLLSGGSSLYGSTEERQAIEVRRLKRELCDAREQVMSLSSQLSTNVSKTWKICCNMYALSQTLSIYVSVVLNSTHK